MGVSADAPYLDSAYKLVAFGDRPVLKLSPGKATLPGPKQVWRRLPITDDLLVGQDEPAPEGRERLLVPVMRTGMRTGPPGTLDAARARLVRDLEGLPATALDLYEPVAPRVRVSPHLRALTATVSRDMREAGRDRRVDLRRSFVLP
jgi:nicotinate phosphoribosyltransferase